MEIYEKTTCVHLKIRSWSAQKKLQRTDLKLGAGGEVPPEKIVCLGRKRIFDPAKLRPFLNLRKSAERACLELGTRLMGGFAIPNDHLDNVLNALEQLTEQYAKQTRVFMADYDEQSRSWLDENLAYDYLLRNTLPSRAEVQDSFCFEYQVFKFTPAKGYAFDANVVANQVLNEIAVAAKRAWEDVLQGSQALSHQFIHNSLRAIYNKLAALCFGDGRIQRLLDTFDDIYQQVPAKGKIYADDPLFFRISSLVLLLTDPARINSIKENASNPFNAIPYQPTLHNTHYF